MDHRLQSREGGMKREARECVVHDQKMQETLQKRCRVIQKKNHVGVREGRKESERKRETTVMTVSPEPVNSQWKFTQTKV